MVEAEWITNVKEINFDKLYTIIKMLDLQNSKENLINFFCIKIWTSIWSFHSSFIKNYLVPFEVIGKNNQINGIIFNGENVFLCYWEIWGKFVSKCFQKRATIVTKWR